MSGPPIENLGALIYRKEVFAENIFASAALRGRATNIDNQIFPCIVPATSVGVFGTNAGPLQDTLRAVPCPMIQGQRINSLGFLVNTTDAGVNGRVAIYTNKSFTDWYPFKLLFETGNIVTNPNLYRSEATNFIIPRTDIYWFVLNFDGVGTAVLRQQSTSQTGTVLGFDATVLQSVLGFTVAGPFGAFPTVYPGDAAPILVASYNPFMSLGA